ncbi:MAG: TIGR02281 family clan AA aspartic protease [Rubrivivax sp.]
MRRRSLLKLAAAAALPAVAQTAGPRVQLAGVMGAKAMLVIDGQTRMLSAGQSHEGITLRAVDGDSARVDTPGGPLLLRVGATPVAVSATPPRASAAREIVLTAGPGGHFITNGSINGQTVSFMVDTGATTVAMSQAEAVRLGLDLRGGRRGMGSTANGPVPFVAVTLTRVRVGDIEVANVEASVLPQGMEHILLGNSFLSRFQMRRENDVMRLVPR